jgi:hypothetical protein
MKVSVTIELEIDCEEEELENIINEMEYDFNYISVDEIVGKQLLSNNLIRSSEIIDFNILK